MEIRIYDAISLAESLINRIEGVNNKEAENIKTHLLSAKIALDTLSNFLGSNCLLDTAVSELVKKGKIYDTQLENFSGDLSEFNCWAQNFNEKILTFKNRWKQSQEAYIQGQSFLEKTHSCRKTILVSFLIATIIIAVIAAAFAIYGTFMDTDWAQNFATVLGVIDFTVGIVGFAIERMSDIKAQQISHSLSKIDSALVTNNLEKASKAASEVNIIANGKSKVAGRDVKDYSVGTEGENSPAQGGHKCKNIIKV